MLSRRVVIELASNGYKWELQKIMKGYELSPKKPCWNNLLGPFSCSASRVLWSACPHATWALWPQEFGFLTFWPDIVPRRIPCRTTHNVCPSTSTTNPVHRTCSPYAFLIDFALKDIYKEVFPVPINMVYLSREGISTCFRKCRNWREDWSNIPNS